MGLREGLISWCVSVNSVRVEIEFFVDFISFKKIVFNRRTVDVDDLNNMLDAVKCEIFEELKGKVYFMEKQDYFW